METTFLKKNWDKIEKNKNCYGDYAIYMECPLPWNTIIWVALFVGDSKWEEKSHQWLGASIDSVGDTILVCVN